jgi:hypothetical protein
MYHDASSPNFRTPVFPLWKFKEQSSREYYDQEMAGL